MGFLIAFFAGEMMKEILMLDGLSVMVIMLLVMAVQNVII